MKYFSLKIVILCILIPPLLYIGLVQSLETYLTDKFTREIEDVYTGNTKALLEGRSPLRETVSANIDRYLNEHRPSRFGISVSVTVTSDKEGVLIYPSQVETGPEAMQIEDPNVIAANNFRLLDNGLTIAVDLEIDRGGPLSLSILFTLIFLSLLTIFFHYKSSVRKSAAEEARRVEEIQRLQELERIQTDKLNTLDSDRKSITAELGRIKHELDNERQKADKNEDSMIEEIEKLEQKLQKNLALQQEQLEEIDTLKDEIQRYEKRKEGRHARKDSDMLKKRFKALYKNVVVHDRFIDGFSELTEDLKIKAEEVVHQLNDDPKVVTIKRKVFGKKNRETVLEVLFSYKGRLYFRNTLDKRIEVLAVGTKNTQSKELEFLNSL